MTARGGEERGVRTAAAALRLFESPACQLASRHLGSRGIEPPAVEEVRQDGVGATGGLALFGCVCTTGPASEPSGS